MNNDRQVIMNRLGNIILRLVSQQFQDRDVELFEGSEEMDDIGSRKLQALSSFYNTSRAIISISSVLYLYLF